MDCIKGHFCAILSPETSSIQNVQERMVSFEKKCFDRQHGHQLPINRQHFCDVAFSAGNARNSIKGDGNQQCSDLVSFAQQRCEGD